MLLSFDGDWRTNLHVMRAVAQAAQALVQAGYVVAVETWEPSQGVTHPVAASGRSAVTRKLAPLPRLHHGRRNAGYYRDGERYGHNG